MSISLPLAVAYDDDSLREAAAALLLFEDRRLDPSMDRKSGKAEGHITTGTSFRCLFLLPPLLEEVAFRATAAEEEDDDDLAMVNLRGLCMYVLLARVGR